jgi:hypothetical protein
MKSVIQFKVGNERNIHFWSDQWLHQCIMKEKYPQLYHLSADQGSIIADVLSNAMVPQISIGLEIYEIISFPS